jgi:acetoin utilization deacetylase AcuC-like enzyme
MTTLFYTHAACLEHRTPEGHPERPDRLRAILQRIDTPAFTALKRLDAPLAEAKTCELAHQARYVDAILDMAPKDRTIHLDPDTVMSPGSLEAALRAAGAATDAVDRLVAGEAANAFVACRPPGHHAESQRAMGFCLFNQAAIAARHALRKHGMARAAVIDWDVHHGNGTQEIFWADPAVMYASTHQMPLYPGTGHADETGEHGTIVNVPMKARDGTEPFRRAFEQVILPRLEAHAPELVIISAGFDAHHQDPLGGMRLTEDDFAWATRKLMDLAGRHAGGRVLSVLEGGYDLDGLSLSVAAHVAALMEG